MLPLPHPGVSRVKRRGLGPTVARPPTDKFHICLQTTCYISDFGGYVFVVSNGSAPLNVHAAMQSSAFIADKIIIKKNTFAKRALLNFKATCESTYWLSAAIWCSKHFGYSLGWINSSCRFAQGIVFCQWIWKIPNMKPFLSFTLKVLAYQYIVLPFRLSLALQTFAKCVDTTLSRSETNGSVHPEPLQWMAHFGPVGAQVTYSQIPAPQSFGMPGTQDQLSQ